MVSRFAGTLFSLLDRCPKYTWVRCSNKYRAYNEVLMKYMNGAY